MVWISFLSDCMIPLVLFYMIGFGILSKRPVFDDFTEGVKTGIKTVFQILPTLVGLMTAVGILRTSGFLDFLGQCLKIPASVFHLPSPIVPVILVRLVSNSAALGLVFDIFKQYGTDSSVGMLASVLMSCTETVFYTMSIYFLSIKVTKTRWTLSGSLLATAAGILASLILV